LQFNLSIALDNNGSDSFGKVASVNIL
jgi:hypothetical protein